MIDLKTLWNAVLRFLRLRREQTAPAPVVVIPAPVELPTVSNVVPIRAKEKRRKPVEKQTLSDLLENIDGTFAALKLPTFRESWLNRDLIVGIRRLGVHVVSPWRFDNRTEGIQVPTKVFPSIMVVNCVPGGETEDSVSPRFMFAVKHRTLPWSVAPQPGIPYQFGCAYPLSGRLLWVNLWLVVNPKTGDVTICDELRPIQNVIPLRSPASRHRHGSPSARYTRFSWSSAELLHSGPGALQERRITFANLFRTMFEWWIDRDSRWSVSVRHRGDRVTFSVSPEDTPTYFADRDKSIKTPSGHTKKIIHHVKRHSRRIGEKNVTVKEHVRGLREFDWRGYHCLVTAPKFTGRLITDFDIPGEESETDEIPEGMMGFSKLGKLLAEVEEADTRKAQA